MQVANKITIEQRRLLLGRRRPRQVRVVARPPTTVIRLYYTLLARRLDDLQAEVRRQLETSLPAVLAEQSESVRHDAWSDTLDQVLEKLHISLRDRKSIDVNLVTADIGQRTSRWQDAEWQRTVHAVMGVKLHTQEPWLADRLRAFTSTNAALIRTQTDRVVGFVENTVRAGVSAGRRPEVLAKELNQKFGVEKRHAKLIARDQVSKLNGELAEMRQRAVGVEAYYWETSDDARVRDGEAKGSKSHQTLDGMLCRWDDDTAYSDDDGQTWKPRVDINAYIGKPGQDFQCRCWPRAKFNFD
jgi:SPP1 gp7 family putative phage head morphogenesis protein